MLKSGTALFVEGQMDLIMAHQAGYTNSVAVSGTAFTAEHLNLVKRFANTILFSFDADSAGEAALKKAAILAISIGAEVKAILLTGGKDPADILKEDPDIWKQAVDGAEPVIDYFLKKINNLLSPQEKIKSIQKDVLPLISVMPQQIEQAHFIKRVAEFLGVDEGSVRADVAKIKVDAQDLPQADAPPTTITPVDRAKMKVLGFYSAFKDRVDMTIVETVWQDIFREKIIDAIHSLPEEKINSLTMEAGMYYEGKDNLGEVAQDIISMLQLTFYEAKLNDILSRLRTTEHGNDHTAAEALLKESQEISNKIYTIKTNRHAQS